MFKQKFFSLFLAIVFVAVSLLFSLAYAQETLNILCFQGYTEDVWVKEFERLTGVKVNATYSGMVEEMFTKAAAGGGQYDLVTIDCGSVQRYYENNLLQPIDLSKISNWDKVSQKFKDIDFMYSMENHIMFRSFGVRIMLFTIKMPWVNYLLPGQSYGTPNTKVKFQSPMKRITMLSLQL